METRISYVYDEELVRRCDIIPMFKSRASMVHALIESYGLLERMKVLPHIKATDDDLRLFHSSGFVEYLKNSPADGASSDETDEEREEYGLSYDCPPFENIYNTILTITGGSLTAANSLVSSEASIAINWNGGWHHAQRDEAEGFCYVNDIVIAIEKLKQKFDRILYIDLDIHHGNGVENAFVYTKKVFTLSFHKYEPGFYPGTGNIDDIGFGNGKGYTCNIPFREGLSDESLVYVFNEICPKIFEMYQPKAAVIQCGSDCLNGDPLGQSNLTHSSIGECIKSILEWNIPLLFLGGGGYNFPNTARLWTYLTSVITRNEENLSMEIPDNEFFLEYGPDYRLDISKGCQKDKNDQLYLNDIIKKVNDHLNYYLVNLSS